MVVYKNMYDEMCKFQKTFFDTYRPCDLGNFIMCKFLWYYAAKLLGENISFSDMHGVLLYDQNCFGVASLNTKKGIKKASDYIGHLYCCESAMDFMLDGAEELTSKIKGRHWEVIYTPCASMIYDGMEFYQFDDFYEKFADGIPKNHIEVTEESLKAWKQCFYTLMSEFFCFIDAEKIGDIVIDRYRTDFFHTAADGETKYFKCGTEYSALSDACDLLRHKYNELKEVRDLIISALRDSRFYGDMFKNMEEAEILQCYDEMYQQPLIVDCWDISRCSGIPAYLIMYSEAYTRINFLKPEDKASLSADLILEMDEFAETCKLHGSVFPFMHSKDMDIHEGTNYIIGACVSADVLGPDGNFTYDAMLKTPSLPDIVLLQWADALYDRYLGELSDLKEKDQKTAA